MNTAVLMLVAVFCSHIIDADATKPIGDVGNCYPGKDLKRFEVLPGGGWDNLRNLPAGHVGNLNYSLCRLTEDKLYLIPDNAQVTPVKQSMVDHFAEIIKHWGDYKSSTSKSVNVGASFSGFGASVSGSFSREYQQVKEHQVQDSSSTVRVTLKHHLYTIALQPGFQLHPHFKSRLLIIAKHIESNNMQMAEYDVDLLIRDYGTHVITTLEAGASLVQIQQVKSTYVNDQEKQGLSYKVKAEASANFFVSVGFHAEYGHSSSSSSSKGFQDSMTHSRIVTHGGPAFRINFTLNQWEDGIPNALVAVDRSGVPLNYIVNGNTLSELNEVSNSKLAVCLEKAIGRYYRFNTVHGCTDHTESNFDNQANVNDGSCNKKRTEFIFGGVYQTIKRNPSASSIVAVDTDQLDDLAQVHPITHDYSCQKGFKSALLKESDIYSDQRYCDCPTRDSCTCRYLPLATYKSYWCYKYKQEKGATEGLLYGGYYTTTVTNSVTETHGCPAKFYPLKFGKDLKVCVSDAYAEGASYAMPFAGFFSCQSGNPLLFQTTSGQLENLIKDAPESKMPGRCPLGYSQHLVAIEDDCEISVCTRSHANHQQLKIKVPPFQIPPQLASMSMLRPAALVWKDLTAAGKEWSDIRPRLIPESSIHVTEPGSNIHKISELNGGQVAGITIAGTMLVVAVISALFFGLRRKNRLFRQSSQSQLIRESQGSGSQSGENIDIATTDLSAYGSV